MNQRFHPPLVMGPSLVIWLGLSASMKTGPTHAAMQQHLGRGGLLKVGGPGMEFECLTGDLMIVDDRPGDKPSNKVVLEGGFLSFQSEVL